MASYNQQNMLTFKAGAAIANGIAVKIGADREHVIGSTAAADAHIGIAQGDAGEAEFPVEVAMPGGGAKARAGGVVTAGAHLTADATGKLVVAGAGERIIAVADEAAVLNDFFACHVVSGSAV